MKTRRDCMAQELCNMTKPSVYKSQRAINPQKLDSHSNVYKGGIYITWHWKTDIPTVTLEKKNTIIFNWFAPGSKGVAGEETGVLWVERKKMACLTCKDTSCTRAYSAEYSMKSHFKTSCMFSYHSCTKPLSQSVYYPPNSI